jgi:hypothetical protein
MVEEGEIDGFDLGELEKFLWQSIPEQQEELTIFDIAGFPHYERVLSNIYAHYLDQYEQHGFGNLFLKALINAISKKATKRFQPKLKYLENWGEWTVWKEEPIEGKFIDILLIDESEQNPKYLIIENKVNAPLDNPLDTYWNYTNSRAKVGVVITLKDTPTDHNGFINITHEEFLSEIKKLIGSYFEKSKNRDLVILRDTMINIDYLQNKKTMDSKLLQFYHENAEKIESIYTLRQNLRGEFLKSVEKLASEYGLVIEGKGAKHYRRLIDNKSKNLHVAFGLYQGDEVEKDAYFFVELTAYKSMATKIRNCRNLKAILKKHNIIEGEDDSIEYNYVGYQYYSFDDIKFDFDGLKNLYEEQWIPLINDIRASIK